MAKKISEKLGVKDGMRSILLHADEKVIQRIDYPQLDRKTTLSGAFDYIHFFYRTLPIFIKYFPNSFRI
jgi:heme oxygenase